MNGVMNRLIIPVFVFCFIVTPVPGGTDAIEVFPNVYKSRPQFPSPYTAPYGAQFITVQTQQGYAVIPVTQENGEIYSCMYGLTGKGRQLAVGDRDFPSLGITGLHSDMELDNKQFITGRTLELINYIARPGRFSYTGFIGEHEDIITVLKRDNRTVERMGLKHSDLAKPLFHIWNTILGKFLGPRYVSPVTVFYNDRKVIFSAEGGKGYQESIFHDEIEGKWNIQIHRELTGAEKMKFNKSFPELNPDEMDKLITELTHITISEMNPFYIMRYGFYEGDTGFRADPVSIAVIFRLKETDEILQIFGPKLPELIGI